MPSSQEQAWVFAHWWTTQQMVFPLEIRGRIHGRGEMKWVGRQTAGSTMTPVLQDQRGLARLRSERGMSMFVQLQQLRRGHPVRR